MVNIIISDTSFKFTMTQPVKSKPLFGVPRMNHNLTITSNTAALINSAPLSASNKEVSQTTPSVDDTKVDLPAAQRILGNSKLKVKKMKDPLAPKKAANSFILFCKEERPRVVELLGTKVPGPVAAELSKRWAELGKEDKDKWDQVAKEERIKYEKVKENYRPSEEFLQVKIAHDRKAMEASWNPSVGEDKMAAYFTYVSNNWMRVATSQEGMRMTAVEIQEELLKQWFSAPGNAGTVVEGRTKKKKVKDPNAPKRPMSAYLLFVKENRATIARENPAMKNTEVLVEVGRRWKDLDEVSRQTFEEDAKKERAEYHLEVSKFKGVCDPSI